MEHYDADEDFIDAYCDEVRENETVEVEGEKLYIPLDFNDETFHN